MLVEGCARLRAQFADAHRILQFVLAREHLKRDLVRASALFASYGWRLERR